MQRFKGLQADETQLKRMEAIINSMTAQERQDYRIINGSRRARIAKGSGTSVQAVNLLIDNLKQMNKMVKQFTDADVGRAPKPRKGRTKSKRRRRRMPRNLSFNESLLKKLQ
jgi:signal recognition particle subunit SRP54